MQSRRRITFLAPLLVATSAATAGAQVPQQLDAPGSKPRYEGVEQTVGDVSPLSVSLRSLQTGLQVPGSFQGVFRVPDEDGHRGRLMRIDGAVAAIFPQSVYVNTRHGEVPLVPAGTVFRIGLPERHAPTQAKVTGVIQMEAISALERTVAEPVQSVQSSTVPQRRTSQPQRVPEPSEADRRTDAPLVELNAEESERHARMRALLRRAAGAEQSTSP